MRYVGNTFLPFQLLLYGSAISFRVEDKIRRALFVAIEFISLLRAYASYEFDSYNSCVASLVCIVCFFLISKNLTKLTDRLPDKLKDTKALNKFTLTFVPTLFVSTALSMLYVCSENFACFNDSQNYKERVVNCADIIDR